MNQEPDNNKPKQSEEDLEELREVIKKLEELQKQQDPSKKKKRPRRPFFAIEFGGVFHHNRIVNFLFNLVLNFTFAYFVIEIFHFATYSDIMNLVLLIVVYSVFEEMYRTYLLTNHFSLIIRSFGTVFFFGYVLIFFLLDQYVFIQPFNFVNGTLLAFFVLIFTIIRYIFSMYVRRYLHKKELR